jgi:Ca2+-binding RTX toxin-like protein
MLFSDIMTWAQANNRSVNIVVPTLNILNPADSTGIRTINQQEVANTKKFILDALSAGGTYADAVISSIEIGNEYWHAGLTSKEYGRIADVLAQAIQEAILESGVLYEPKMIVQIGLPYGPDFDINGEHGDASLTWVQKLKLANNDIISSLSATSKALLDGLGLHFYYDASPNPTSDDVRLSFYGVANSWLEAGLNYTYNFTEWNVGPIHPGQSNFSTGTPFLEAFEYMARVNGTSAYVWPVNHNTFHDLAGRPGVGPGHLSVNGAIFKLLSENVPGHQWTELNLDIEDPNLYETSYYQNAKSRILFVASYSDKVISDNLNIRNLLGNMGENSILTLARVSRDKAEDAFVGTGSGARISYETSASSDRTQIKLKLGEYEILMIRMVDVDAGEPRILNGSARPETFYSGARNNTVNAGGGRDRIFSGGGADTIFGGTGRDTLNGGTGADSMIGGGGRDVYIIDNPGDAVVEAHNGGIDRINTTINIDLNNALYANVENVTLTGTGNFNVWGSATGNQLTGNKGRNILEGREGNDLIRGMAKKDMLLGGTGKDTLYGGGGNDTINGGTGADSMIGGLGNDIYMVDNRRDVIVETGIGGFDQIHATIDISLTTANYTNVEHVRLLGTRDLGALGSAANNRLIGNSGNNILDGRKGNDVLRGLAGNDHLLGGDRNDRLDGGVGNDTLDGGAGNDTLIGGSGNDILTGGGGGDTFLFRNGFKNDTITDFHHNTDTLQLLDFGVNDASQAQRYAEQIGSDVVFDFGHGDKLIIQNITISALVDDMIFA